MRVKVSSGKLPKDTARKVINGISFTNGTAEAISDDYTNITLYKNGVVVYKVTMSAANAKKAVELHTKIKVI